MHWVGECNPNSKVLIHGGGSGVGTSAIQLAVDNGNTVFATAGTDEKNKMALKLGAEKSINYKSEDFSIELKSAGIDLILDCVGGSFWKQNIKVLVWNRNFSQKLKF